MIKSRSKINKALPIILILLFGIYVISLGQSQNKKLLIGKWLFATFELPKSRPPDSAYIAGINKNYKGVIYTFTTANEFIMQKKNGGKDWNKQTTFTLIKNDRYIQLVEGKQTMRIDYLDNRYLKIFVEGSAPTGVFKRIK